MLNVKNVKTTVKKKKNKNKNKNKNLWDAFDKEYNPETPLELLYSKDAVSREVCELCNSQLQYSESNYLTCSNDKCSVIYKDSLDESAEWRYYGADDSSSTDPTRCGMPVNHLLKESSYGCKVICGGRSSYEMRKIKRYTEWHSMPYKEKSQYDEFEHIKVMSRIAGYSHINTRRSVATTQNHFEMRTFRGFNREGVIAASVYIACRIHNYPRTAKEIATIFKLDTTAATKGCKHAVHLLEKNETGLENNEKTHFHKTKPIAFIERYCSRLNMNSELIKLCKFVAMKIERQNLIPENTPHSVAAGIVYFVAQTCNLKHFKKANTHSEISEVTINKCYKKLDKKIKDTLIPISIVQKILAINPYIILEVIH